MKSSKAKKTDLDRIVSRILQTPPKDRFDDYEYTDKIFGFDYDGFVDSKLDEVDPQTSEEYEFDKIYKSFEMFIVFVSCSIDCDCRRSHWPMFDCILLFLPLSP